METLWNAQKGVKCVNHLLGGATCTVSSRGNRRRSTVRLRKDHY